MSFVKRCQKKKKKRLNVFTEVLIPNTTGKGFRILGVFGSSHRCWRHPSAWEATTLLHPQRLASSERQCLVQNIFALTKGRIRSFLHSVTPDGKKSVKPERGWPYHKCHGGGAREVDPPATPQAVVTHHQLWQSRFTSTHRIPWELACHPWASSPPLPQTGRSSGGPGETRACQTAFLPAMLQNLTDSTVSNDSCRC